MGDLSSHFPAAFIPHYTFGSDLDVFPAMSRIAKRRLETLSQHLVQGIPDEGTFENIPKIRHVAGDSVGARVQGKVVIVTGMVLSLRNDDICVKLFSCSRSI